MSTLEQIDHAVEVLGKENLILLHACSTYPALLRGAEPARDSDHARALRRSGRLSGHETGIASTVAAVVLGACCVERHITLDRSMWGSDHAASLEPNGISRVVRDIRLVETVDGRRRQARLRARAARSSRSSGASTLVSEMKHLKAIVAGRRRRADRRRRLVGPERRGVEAVLFRGHHGRLAGA